MRKKIILSVIVFLIFFALGTALKVKAGDDESARGWMWGGSEDRDLGVTGAPGDDNESGMGWLNTNCASEVDIDGNGTLDAKMKVCSGGANDHKNCNGPDAVLCGAGINCVETCNLVDYGVDIPNGSGNLSGYAWSENLGWISFNASDLAGCPSGVCSARRTNDNKLEGWARIIGIKDEFALNNSGGWQGFISLKDTLNATPIYQVKIDNSTGKLFGFGWNGENKNDPVVTPGINIANGLGYFDFKDVKIELSKTLKICVNSCSVGENITGIVKSIALNDPISLKACYNTSLLCDDNSGDFTNSASWVQTDNPDNAVSSQPGYGNYKGVNSGTEQINVSYDGEDVWTRINVGCVSDPNYCKLDTDPAKSLRESTCIGSFFPNNCGSYACPGKKDCTGWIETGPQ